MDEIRLCFQKKQGSGIAAWTLPVTGVSVSVRPSPPRLSDAEVALAAAWVEVDRIDRQAGINPATLDLWWVDFPVETRPEHSRRTTPPALNRSYH
jgi:hypothetical protein